MCYDQLLISFLLQETYNNAMARVGPPPDKQDILILMRSLLRWV